jgi:hypothetical protein
MLSLIFNLGNYRTCLQNGVFSNFICLPGDHQASYR